MSLTRQEAKNDAFEEGRDAARKEYEGALEEQESEIADLKRKLKELEGDLTTAYMAGYHKRDDEVRNLRAHADALAGALEERDGGTHDVDCKVWSNRGCNCGHDQSKTVLSAYRKYKEPGE